ncbi:MAG: hypothetical protein Q7V57_02890 [Actinomycetota bacterium]|nr:hypothetical protein [Actinomycetota bacterium]
MTRVTHLLLRGGLGLLPLGLAIAGCSGDGPFQSSDDTAVVTVADDTASTTPATGIAANEFLPEDQNISDCVGTNERPGCGSRSKGGLHLYLVFAALFGGVGFIAWRVSIGIRARDAVMNATPDDQGDKGDPTA